MNSEDKFQERIDTQLLCSKLENENFEEEKLNYVVSLSLL
jgi:hypothetical protein